VAEQLEVTAVARDGWATDVSVRGHELRIDEPTTVDGGRDTGMMPTEAFMASIAACFCMSVAWAGRKRDIEVPGLKVIVTAKRAGIALRYGHIHVDTQAELDDETLALLVERARPACWVSNTLAAGVEVEYGHTSLDARFRK
jgi:putative redox protein